MIQSIRHTPGGQWVIELECDGRREWMVVALTGGSGGHVCLKAAESIRRTPAEAEAVARVRKVQSGQRLAFPLALTSEVVEEPPAAGLPAVWLESYRLTGPRRYRMQLHLTGPGGAYESRGEYEWQLVDGDRFSPLVRVTRWPEDGIFHPYQWALEAFVLRADRGAAPPLPYRLRLRFGGD